VPEEIRGSRFLDDELHSEMGTYFIAKALYLELVELYYPQIGVQLALWEHKIFFYLSFVKRLQNYRFHYFSAGIIYDLIDIAYVVGMESNEKKYSLKTLQLLTGKKEVDIENVPGTVLTIAEVVEEPEKLPYLIEAIKSMEIEDREKFRFVLLRVQIDSMLHMNEDIEKYQKRLYVSQVIEKLLYGEMLLLEEGKEEEEEKEEEQEERPRI